MMNTRTQSMIRLLAGCLGLPAYVLSAEVVIHPGNGIETNVAAIVSASVVRINPGASGGGIVHLNASSSYSAPTTLGCGTLVADRVAAAGTASSLGKSGLVSIGAGTFRYDGPDGGWTDRPITNDTPVRTQAAVYDIRHDLTLACDLIQARGSFVKTGPGTLHLAGTGTTRLNQLGALNDNADGIQHVFVPNANGDSPTNGYRGFHVLEGKLVLGERGGTYRIGNANNVGIGGWTKERGQEVDATVEVVGGDVQFSGWFMHGSYNGNTNNTPERMPRSTLRVTGGNVSVGDCFSMGRNKLDYSGFPQRSAPRLEVYGGTMTVSDAINMADDRGACSAVEVTNGTLVAALAQTGRVTGNADTTNTVDVSGTGVLMLAGAFTNRRDVVSHVTVSGGGYLSLARIANAAGRISVDVSNGGTLSIDEIECLCGRIACRFDGATVRGRSIGRKVLLEDNAAVTAEIGPSGLVLEPAAHGASVVARPLVSSVGGVVVRGQSATATNVFAAVQMYAGPTRLERGALAFEGEGALPMETDLVVTDGTLLVTNRSQIVRTMTLGTDGANTSIGVHVAASGFTPIVARSDFAVVGAASLAIRMDGIVACGTYPVLDVPVAKRAVLAQLAARSTLSAALSANMTAALATVSSDGRALLVVKVESTVRHVVPEGGTETLNSLAFASSPELLVVGPGTLRYTGTGEDVGGLTLDAGVQRCAILDVVHDFAPHAVRIGDSALMKIGAGDLILAGEGPFELGNTKVNRDLMLGIGADGSSPVDTFQHVTVADGRLVIGTPGGGTSTPHIDLSGRELHVGGVTASAANGRTETSGEFVIESGTVDCYTFLCGYYSGSGGAWPAGGTYPTLTMNGGVLRAGSFTIGYDPLQRHVAHARVNMAGGRIETGTLSFQSSPGDTNCPPTTTWTQTGGDVVCSAFTCGGRPVTDGAYGPSRMTLSGGTFSVLGAMKLQNGTDATIEVGDGATFQCGAISGVGAASSILRFDGGLWRSFASTASSVTVADLTHLYLARRTTLDLTDVARVGGWVRIDQKMESEADGAGLMVTGGGAVSFGPVFAESDLTGPLCISNGVTLWQDGTGGTVSNLVLGTDGVTGNVILDVDAATGAGFTVLGTLDIRSPVAVRAHAGASPLACDVAGGTYTALVYWASQSVDLSKFVASADARVASVAYADVALGGGWRAVVATISTRQAGAYSMGERAWSETSAGGKWHSQANWTGWAPPDGAGEAAGFRPATAASVPVTLARAATVGNLSLSGAANAGYRLAGETLTLDAAGRMPAVSADTGVHEIAAPLATEYALKVDTRADAAVTFGGGIVGADASVLVNREGGTGGGTVSFGVLDGIRQVSAGCGRTILSDMSFAAAADALQLGGGTLRYEGPEAGIPGIALANGGGRAAVLDVPFGRILSVRSMTAASTAFIKAGAGDLKLSGTGTFALGAAVSNRTNQANTYIRANGDSPISTYRKCNVSQGRIVQGTVGDPNDAPVVTCSDFCVGVDSVEGEDCEYVMNNGILNASSCYVGYYHGVTRPCRGQFTLNGGAVTSSWVRLGQTGSGSMYSRPAVVVNGGRWRVSGAFTLGYQKASPGATDCSVTVNGGELDIGGVLTLGRAGSNTNTVYLHDGVLRAENIVRSNGTARVFFDGGTFAPYCAAEANRTMKGLTAAYIRAGGAVIDLSRAGGAYTVTQALQHDPACVGADGGLRVTGGGTLVLAGANTYTGPTTLEGSALDLNGTTKTLTRLEGAGRIQNGTLAVNDVLRPGGSGTTGILHLDAATTVTGIVEMELGDRIVGTGLVDVTDATLLVTDLNGLPRWNLHLLIRSPGGVRGTFAETNLEGSGYQVLNTGTALYLWNGSKSTATTIYVR